MQSQGANVITLMGLIRVFQGKRGTGESDRRRRDDRGRERVGDASLLVSRRRKRPCNAGGS